MVMHLFINEEKLIEYVELCNRKELKKSPLEQIDVLANAWGIMREDLKEELSKRGVSNNWAQWWWEAVKKTHRTDSGYLLNMVYGEESTGYGGINLDNFARVVEMCEAITDGCPNDIGPGSMAEDNGDTKVMVKPKVYKELNERFPLLPEEERPIVTLQDMVFYELLMVWERTVERLSREAIVDGLIKSRHDVLPERNRMRDDFIKYCLGNDEMNEKSGTELRNNGHDRNVKGNRETKPNKKEKKTMNHIAIGENEARKLYNALCDDSVKWLMEPQDEDEFVNILTLPPSGKRIKLKQVCQVRYITKGYLFTPKEGNETRKVTKKEWEIIMQIFDAENGKMENVQHATKTPQNSKNLNCLMG